MTFPASDERAHEPGDGDWAESWSFDFGTEGAAPDADTGGFVRLVLLPGARTAWYWATLVVPSVGVVVVRDHEVPLPRRTGDADLEVRADSLWAEIVCEEPFEHWGLGLEAFGLRVDDPRDEIGDRLAVGLDLEWEVVAPPFEYDDRYAQAGIVHGELLVGPDRFPFEGRGVRDHEWGRLGWRNAPWQRGWCCAGDELAIEVVVDDDGCDGWVWRIGEAPVPVDDALVEAHGSTGRWVLNHDLEVRWDALAEAWAPPLTRSLCTLAVAETPAVGWLESAARRIEDR